MQLLTLARGVERATQVFDEIIGVLEPDGEPDRAFGDAGGREILG